MELNEARQVLEENGYVLKESLTKDELDTIDNSIGNLENYIDKSYKELHELSVITMDKDKILQEKIAKAFKAFNSFSRKINELRNEFDFG